MLGDLCVVDTHPWSHSRRADCKTGLPLRRLTTYTFRATLYLEDLRGEKWTKYVMCEVFLERVFWC